MKLIYLAHPYGEKMGDRQGPGGYFQNGNNHDNPAQLERDQIERNKQWLEMMNRRNEKAEKPKPKRNWIVSFFKGE